MLPTVKITFSTNRENGNETLSMEFEALDVNPSAEFLLRCKESVLGKWKALTPLRVFDVKTEIYEKNEKGGQE